MHARRASAFLAARAARACIASAKVAACASAPSAPAPAHCLQGAGVDASGTALCRLDCADFLRASKSRSSDGAPLDFRQVVRSQMSARRIIAGRGPGDPAACEQVVRHWGRSDATRAVPVCRL